MSELVPLPVVKGVAAVAIFTVMLWLGMRGEKLSDVAFLWRHPGLFARSILAVLVVVPALAIAIAVLLPLPKPAAIALVLLAISPAPPMELMTTLKAGRLEYARRLHITLNLLAVVSVPTTLALLSTLFPEEHAHVSPLEVGGQVFVAQLLPLAIGMGARLLRPALADRIASPLGKGALALMLALVVLVLVDDWRALTEPGWSPTLAIVLLTAGALLAGHLLGGPEPATRTILAVASASRYPALCFLVVALNYPRMGVERVVIAYTLIAALARMPYIAWRRRQAALPAPEAKAGPPGEGEKSVSVGHSGRTGR
jgi:BASS family bile acid:Na+ symporter